MPSPMCCTAETRCWPTRWARARPLKWWGPQWRPSAWGLCQKSLFVVPNHLTEQWASEFLRLYPSANILVTTKKDFEKHNRKKFCARIATGDYDAIIMGTLSLKKSPSARNARSGCCMSRFGKSPRASLRWRPAAASGSRSSSWNARKNLWRRGWKSCKRKAARTMW